jgi:hypothetical protein
MKNPPTNPEAPFACGAAGTPLPYLALRAFPNPEP